MPAFHIDIFDRPPLPSSELLKIVRRLSANKADATLVFIERDTRGKYLTSLPRYYFAEERLMFGPAASAPISKAERVPVTLPPFADLTPYQGRALPETFRFIERMTYQRARRTFKRSQLPEASASWAMLLRRCQGDRFPYASWFLWHGIEPAHVETLAAECDRQELHFPPRTTPKRKTPAQSPTI